MQFVYVASKPPTEKGKPDYIPAISNVTDKTLYSLIDAFSAQEFDLCALERAANDINEYKRKYVLPVGGDIKIDSGGYSIIQGQVSPENTRKAIKSYHVYAETEIENYDHLFSLDIPVNLKYPSFNTVENIYDYNFESLSDSINLLVNYPEFINKWHFVYHFKVVEQYEIWCRLYNDLNLGQYIRHRAIGGMVSLKEKAKIDFSPFIATAYRCLLDYMNSANPGNDFKLHFLGINVRYDRFTISYLEKLFQRYMEDYSTITATYDSINYARTAMFQHHNLSIYNFQEGNLDLFPTITDVPENLINSIYPGSLSGAFYNELEIKQSTGSYDDSMAYAALNISSEMSVDRFFEFIIDEYSMVDQLLTSSSYTSFEHRTNLILQKLLNKYQIVFTKKMIKSIRDNLDYVYSFHRWFRDKRDYNELDRLTRIFIKDINFPKIFN